MTAAAAPAVAAPASWRRGARLWALFFAAVFLFMVGRVFLALRSDFVPAQHLDVGRSEFRATADGRARLTLLVLHVAGPEAVRAETLAPEPGKAPLTVRLYATSAVSEDELPTGEVVLELDLPAVRTVRVLDMRWDHPREHPQGHEFELQTGGSGA